MRVVSARTRLILEHRALVERIAQYVRRRLPKCVELEDLIQYGMLGLVIAADRFVAHESKATFATFASYRVHGAILDGLRIMRMGPKRKAPVLHVPLEEAMPLVREDAIPLDARIDLERAIAGLDDRALRLIAQQYAYGQKQKDLQDEIGLSKSRVSQLHGRALRELAKALGRPA